MQTPHQGGSLLATPWTGRALPGWKLLLVPTTGCSARDGWEGLGATEKLLAVPNPVLVFFPLMQVFLLFLNIAFLAFISPGRSAWRLPHFQKSSLGSMCSEPFWEAQPHSHCWCCSHLGRWNIQAVCHGQAEPEHRVLVNFCGHRRL